MRRFLNFVVYDEPPDPDVYSPNGSYTPLAANETLPPTAPDSFFDTSPNEPENKHDDTLPQNVASVDSPKALSNLSQLDSPEIVSTDSTHTGAPGTPDSSVVTDDRTNSPSSHNFPRRSTSSLSGAIDTAPIVSSVTSAVNMPLVGDAPVLVLECAGIVEQDESDSFRPQTLSGLPISKPRDSTSSLPNIPSNGESDTNAVANGPVGSIPRTEKMPTNLRSNPAFKLVNVDNEETSILTRTNFADTGNEGASKLPPAMEKYSASPSDAQLRSLAEVLSEFTKRIGSFSSNEERMWLGTPAAVVNALRELAEVMVWADQHDHALWDTFMECAFMSLLVQCLESSVIILNGPKLTSHQPHNRITANGNTGPVFQDEANTSSDPGLRSRNDGGSVVHEVETEPSPDSAPLLTSQNGAFRPEESTQSESTSGVEAELQDTSLQEIIVPFPNHSLSSPAVQSSDLLKSALYDTFSLSHSSPGISLTGDSSAGENTKQVQPNSFTVELQSQVLQTLSITVQSVSRKESLFCIFSSNHINNILSFPFSFDNEEMLGLLLSAIKTITLKLDHSLLQFFFDPKARSFPLYSVVVQFYDHPDSMVRIAVRNISLALCALDDSEVLDYIAQDDMNYIRNSVAMLKRLCGTVAHAFELLLDDGREVRRTRTRTGIFRQSVRISDVEDKLLEIENLCAYFGDMAEVSHSRLYSTIVKRLATDIFAPLFRPIASYASPEAISVMRRKGWGLATGDVANPGVEPALPMFDAAARILLLAFILSFSERSAVADSLVKELVRPAVRFEGRHVFNALKAIVADVSGTERLTFVALLAMEAALACDSINMKMIRGLGYDFGSSWASNGAKDEDELDEVEVDASNSGDMVLTENIANGIKQNGESGEKDEDMLMTLHDFDVPTTPTVLRTMTPSMPPMSPGTPATSPSLLFRSLSSSASIDESMWRSYAGDTGTLRKTIENGTASLQDVLCSVALVVRRREVRTIRVLRAIVRIMFAVAEKNWDWLRVASVSKEIITKLASSLKAFVKSRNTTIVGLERAFENFWRVSDSAPSTDIDDATRSKLYMKNDSPIVSIEGTVSLASESPRGAGKRRRIGGDGIVSPEEEDARTLFEFMRAYELAARKVPGCKSSLSITEVVKAKLEEYGLEDSYLDKRDALEAVADAITTHPDLV